MSLSRQFASGRSPHSFRAIALVAVAVGCGVVACSDEPPVNPPQGPQGTAGTGTTGGSKGGGGSSSKAGSSNTSSAGEGGEAAGAGGDNGSMPSAGTGGGGGNGGMSGGGTGGGGGIGGGGTGGVSGGASGGGGAGGGGAGSGGAGGGGTGTGGAGTGGGGTGGGGTGGKANSDCGNGTVGAGEECEPPSSATCSDDCQQVATTDCTDCEAGAACAPFAQACITSNGITGAGSTALDPTVITQLPTVAARTTACFDVEECIQDTNCADGDNTFTSCFCGAFTTAQCAAAPDSGAGSPAGPCAAKIKAGMGAGATNAQVLARFTNRNYPAGAGINRFNCLKNNPVCAPLCGF